MIFVFKKLRSVVMSADLCVCVCVCYIVKYVCVFLPSVFQLKWRGVGGGVGKIYNRPFQHLLGY